MDWGPLAEAGCTVGLLRRSQSHRAGADCSRAAAWPEWEGKHPGSPSLLPASLLPVVSLAWVRLEARWHGGLGRCNCRVSAPWGRVKQRKGHNGAGSKQAKTTNYRLVRKEVRAIVHGLKKINSRSIEDLNIRNKRIKALKKYRRIWLQPWSTHCFKEHTN